MDFAISTLLYCSLTSPKNKMNKKNNNNNNHKLSEENNDDNDNNNKNTKAGQWTDEIFEKKQSKIQCFYLLNYLSFSRIHKFKRKKCE